MTSAALSTELDVLAEQAWAVVADLDAYAAWNPCFRAVRGTLKANDLLEVDLQLSETAPATRSLSALVLDVDRFSHVRWLLLRPSRSIEDGVGGQSEAGLYDLDLVRLGPSRVRLVQRLTLAPDPDGCSMGRAELEQRLQATGRALEDRASWLSANGAPHRQIQSTVRVTSHSGLSRCRGRRRPGLRDRIADLVGRRLRLAA